jgi:hypothetical protein
MNNVTDATSKNQNYDTSLDNCSKSAEEFSNYIEKAGKKAQTAG